MLATSKIVGMTGAAKADLFAKGARELVEGRYVATLALASLANSHAYLEMNLGGVQELAAARSDL